MVQRSDRTIVGRVGCALILLTAITSPSFALTPAVSPTAAPIPATAPPQATAQLPHLSTQEWVMLALIVGGPIILVILFIKGWLRPGGLKSAGIRQVSPLAWWEWLMASLIPLMAVAFGQTAGLTLFKLTPASIESPRGAFLASASAFIPGAVVALFLARLMSQSASSAGLKPTKTDLPLGAAGFALALPVIVSANWAGGRIYTQLTGDTVAKISHSTLSSIAEYKDDPWAWGSAAVAIVVAPILEELVYRGFLQSMILRLTGFPGLAVLISSALFTAMHWSAVNHSWPSLVPIAVLSLACGMAMERSKRIGVPIVMHMLFNAANIALATLN